MNFEERAESMGLVNYGSGCFYYGDIHAEVLYRSLITKDGANMMDNYEIPHIALFTKAAGLTNQNWNFQGVLSNSYKFEGNEVINEAIRNSISEIGSPILKEDIIISKERTQMHNCIIIENPNSIPEVGNIYPQIVVFNSYNGTRAKSISFGFTMLEDEEVNISFGFKTKLGELRQIHHEGSQTTMSAPIGGYVQAFSENISDLFEQNYSNRLTEDDVMRTLNLVEKIGKKKRDVISNALDLMFEEDGVISSWQLFLTLTMHSTIETNLNTKRFLENVAERVLVVPERLMTTMKVVNMMGS